MPMEELCIGVADFCLDGLIYFLMELWNPTRCSQELGFGAYPKVIVMDALQIFDEERFLPSGSATMGSLTDI